MVIAKEFSAIILAAGRSSRLGREKVLLELSGIPIVRLVADEVVKAGIAECTVITNPRNHQAVERVVREVSATAICNDHFEDGMASSIAKGIGAVSPRRRATILLQGDQPFVESSMLLALMAKWNATKLPYIAASYDELVTTPVLFSRYLFADLQELKGDAGAKRVLQKHRGATVEFPAWRSADVDTDSDYVAVQNIWTKLHPEASVSCGRPNE